MSDSEHDFIVVMKDGLTMNMHVFLNGDVAIDPPFEFMKEIKRRAGKLGRLGVVAKIISESDAKKIFKKDPSKFKQNDVLELMGWKSSDKGQDNG